MVDNHRLSRAQILHDLRVGRALFAHDLLRFVVVELGGATAEWTFDVQCGDTVHFEDVEEARAAQSLATAFQAQRLRRLA